MSQHERPLFNSQAVRDEIQALNGATNVRDWELKLLERVKGVSHHRTRDVLNVLTYPLVRKYVGNPTDNVRAAIEKSQSLSQLTEELLDLPPQVVSYGLFTPTYSQLLQKHKEAVPRKGHHISLLVGALTPATIQEYSSTVRSVHPDAKCLVMDIEGETTAKVNPETATFLYATATRMPFRTNTLDSIHSNYLLDKLRPTSKADTTNLEDYFLEAYRVLRKSGVLIGVEGIHPADPFLPHFLLSIGFKEVIMQSAVSFASRRDIARYFQKGDYNTQVEDCASFYAIK